MKNFNVAIFGLDGAGKTTASLRLDRDWSFPSVGKWGFSTKKVVVKTKTYVNLCIPFPYNHKTALNLFDLGGHVKIRKIWPSYYKDVYACIFVIDANDPLRFPEAKEALYTVANDLMMSVKPFLVISNVKDKKTAVPLQELEAYLDIPSISSNTSSALKARFTLIECEMNKSLSTLLQGKDMAEVGAEALIHEIESNEKSIAWRIALDTNKIGVGTAKSKKVHPSDDIDGDNTDKKINSLTIK